MEQAAMPGDGTGEVVAVYELRFRRVQERETLARSILRLEHVRDRMRAPRVVRRSLDRATADALGIRQGPSLLERECVAAEHVAIPRHRIVPCGEAALERPTQRRRAAEHEVDRVLQLEAEQVARVLA